MNEEEALEILGIADVPSDDQIVYQVKQQLKKLHNRNTEKLSKEIEACKFLTDGKEEQAEVFSNLVISAIDSDKLDFLELLLRTVKSNDKFNYLNTERALVAIYR